MNFRFQSMYKNPISKSLAVEWEVSDRRTFEDGSMEIQVTMKTEYRFGITIAHALKRTIMATAPGVAVVAMRINDATHEFGSIDGIKETTQYIILNLRNLAVRFKDKDTFFTYLTINKNKYGPVTAADIAPNDAVEIINKDLHICTLDKNASVEMELIVAVGSGYKQAHEHIFAPPLPPRFFPVDSDMSKVQCSYVVENHTGGNLNYDLVKMQITTSGSFSPEEILRGASDRLLNCFYTFSSVKEKEDQKVGEELKKDPILEVSVSDLSLSVRVKNCLINNDVRIVKDLVEKSQDDLKSMAGFGEACLSEVLEFLTSHGLSLKSNS